VSAAYEKAWREAIIGGGRGRAAGAGKRICGRWAGRWADCSLVVGTTRWEETGDEASVAGLEEAARLIGKSEWKRGGGMRGSNPFLPQHSQLQLFTPSIHLFPSGSVCTVIPRLSPPLSGSLLI